MKHWLKRALTTAALASGAMIATAGMASASSESPLPVDPEAIISLTQEATNTNETNQTAEPSAETNQVNVYAPIAVLSTGSNNGKVDQSNEADTKVVAVNENGTEQSIDQDQTAGDDRDSCGKCGSESGGSQTQTAENNNTTNQNAEPSAETNQVNVYAPVAVLSKDSNNGKVDQSNEAETTVVGVNQNGTEQSIDQDQTAGDDFGGCGKCGSEGDGYLEQYAENNNTTNQNATPSATTNQSNEIGSDKGQSWAPKEWKSDDSHRENGGAEQANEAETTVVAVNENGTEQSIDQDQTAGDDRDSCGKCGSESGGSQTQTAENNNTTNQDATPSATTNQSNQTGSDQAQAPNPTWNKGYESERERDGAEQSNEAETTVLAVNENGTEQSIDQDQTARDKDDRDHQDKDDRDHQDKDDRDHKDKDDRDHKDKDDRDHKDKDDRDHKDKDDRDHKDKDCLGADCDRCVRTQSQTAGNNNTTNQNAQPNAETDQSNMSDRGQKDLDQSNEAGTKAIAANRNGTGQSIGQSQHLSS